MLSHLFFYDNTATCHNPYWNIAIEEWLTMRVPEDAVILFLWQNDRTVVIGRNQNAWRECDVERLTADGGHLARRLSGGGAVYHHMGNLNFTFCAPRALYDVGRQVSVIAEAAKRFGIRAEKTGRNDIMADGRKFSGNAFYKTKTRAYHHGTILIDEDMGDMVKYLATAGSKLSAKSVASVPARVVNLASLSSDVTVPAFAAAMRDAFSAVYTLSVERLTEADLDEKEIGERARFFDSFAWKYGGRGDFTDEREGRFSWGFLRLYFSVEDGVIRSADVDSDGLAAGIIAEIPRALIGAPYLAKEMQEKIFAIPCEDEEERAVLADAASIL